MRRERKRLAVGKAGLDPAACTQRGVAGRKALRNHRDQMASIYYIRREHKGMVRAGHQADRQGRSAIARLLQMAYTIPPEVPYGADVDWTNYSAAATGQSDLLLSWWGAMPTRRGAMWMLVGHIKMGTIPVTLKPTLEPPSVWDSWHLQDLHVV